MRILAVGCANGDNLPGAQPQLTRFKPDDVVQVNQEGTMHAYKTHWLQFFFHDFHHAVKFLWLLVRLMGDHHVLPDFKVGDFLDGDQLF